MATFVQDRGKHSVVLELGSGVKMSGFLFYSRLHLLYSPELLPGSNGITYLALSVGVVFSPLLFVYVNGQMFINLGFIILRTPSFSLPFSILSFQLVYSVL